MTFVEPIFEKQRLLLTLMNGKRRIFREIEWPFVGSLFFVLSG